MIKLLALAALSILPALGQTLTTTGTSPNTIATAKAGNAVCVFDNSHFYYAYTMNYTVQTPINYPVVTCNDVAYQTSQQVTVLPQVGEPASSTNGSFRFGPDSIYWYLTPAGSEYSGHMILQVFFFHNGAFAFPNVVQL